MTHGTFFCISSKSSASHSIQDLLDDEVQDEQIKSDTSLQQYTDPIPAQQDTILIMSVCCVGQ